MWSSWSPMTIPESWHFFSFSFKNASSHKSHDLCLASHTTYCCYLHTSSLSTTHHCIWHAFQCFFLSQLPPIVLGNFVIKMDGPVEFLTLNILNSPLVPTTKQTHNECVIFFFSHNDLSFHFASATQSLILNPVVWIHKMNFAASDPSFLYWQWHLLFNVIKSSLLPTLFIHRCQSAVSVSSLCIPKV